MHTKEKVSASEIKRENRNQIGYKVLVGGSATAIAEEYKTNREFVYSQKTRIQQLVKSDEKLFQTPVVVLDKQMIEKIIIGCMLVCKGSTEDTQHFLDWVFEVWVSMGKISGIHQSTLVI